MHAHFTSRDLPLFLANGVTLVRKMNGTPEMVALRERVARGEVVGPRLLVASPLLVGEPLRFRHKLILSAGLIGADQGQARLGHPCDRCVYTPVLIIGPEGDGGCMDQQFSAALPQSLGHVGV